MDRWYGRGRWGAEVSPSACKTLEAHFPVYQGISLWFYVGNASVAYLISKESWEAEYQKEL